MSKTIALVDDDRNILTSISMALEREGYKVQTYIDGQSALVGLSRNPPDLAVVDLKMPKLTGEELLQKIRKKMSIPIIFLTSKDEEVDESGSVVTTSILTRYDIHLQNSEPFPITGCEVHYLIFKSKGGVYSSSANQGSFDELPEYLVQYGTSQMDDLPPNETTTIITNLIIVNEFEPKGGGKDAEEDLMGIWVRVINEKKQIVFEAKSSEPKLKNVTWYDPYAETKEEDEDQ